MYASAFGVAFANGMELRHRPWPPGRGSSSRRLCLFELFTAHQAACSSRIHSNATIHSILISHTQYCAQKTHIHANISEFKLSLLHFFDDPLLPFIYHKLRSELVRGVYHPTQLCARGPPTADSPRGSTWNSTRLRASLPQPQRRRL